MLSLSEAAILSTTLEAVLYGLSLLMMFLTFRTLLRRHEPPGQDLNWGMELGVNIARLYRGFITRGPHLPGGPDQYFAGAADATFLVKSILYDFQTVILDGVVQSVLVIAIPVLGWVALINFDKHLSTGGLGREDGPLDHSSILPDSRNEFVNDLGTLMLHAIVILAFKIWTVARRSARYQASSNLTSLLDVIVESGAIYSITITIALATFVAKNSFVYVVLDMISPIISIVFSMIIVRVGLARESASQNVLSQGALSWSSPPPRVIRHHREDSTFEIGGTTFVDVTHMAQCNGGSAIPPQAMKEPEAPQAESEPLKANNSFDMDDREALSLGKAGDT
ncbi:hypothetical protein C8T65DRAFT_696910 [Cerioporus squamosus]|nr:hypothetical protein C8T65DRAFT_696910 [Cerioporus squamosus]